METKKHPGHYLINYLNQFKTPEEAIAALKKEGIICRQKGDTYLLKYHYGCKFDRIYHLACRGTIVRHTSSGWQIVSYPLDKFFNWTEFLSEEVVNYYRGFVAANRIEDAIKAGFLFKSYNMQEKIDGTCCVLYYDNGWKVHTLGTFEAEGRVVQNGIVSLQSNRTYAEVFWETFDRAYGHHSLHRLDSTLYHFDEEKIYIFELIHPEARIVVPYEQADLRLIAVRDRRTFDELDVFHESAQIYHRSGGLLQFRLPAMLNGSYTYQLFHGINLQQFLDETKQMFAQLNPAYHKVFEGFVAITKVTEGVYYRCKIKTFDYLQQHRIRTSTDVKEIAELVVTGKIDDLVLTYEDYSLVHKLKDIYSDLMYNLDVKYQNIRNVINEKVDPADAKEWRKQFALWIKDMSPAEKQWMFANLDNNETARFQAEIKLLVEKFMTMKDFRDLFNQEQEIEEEN